MTRLLLMTANLVRAADLAGKLAQDLDASILHSHWRSTACKLIGRMSIRHEKSTDIRKEQTLEEYTQLQLCVQTRRVLLQ